MKRSELRALIKEELKKSLREGWDVIDTRGTQVSRGKIVKLPTGRFKAKNKEGDTALFSTEEAARRYATAASEEEWNAKFGPQSKKKTVKEWGPPRSPKEKTGMDYYDDSHKGSNPDRNRYDRGDDDDYDRRRDADSEDGFDDKYHRIGEVTASDYYKPPRPPKKPKKEAITKKNGETCRWFLHCGRPATGRTPHPAFADGVPTCDRCAKFAIGKTNIKEVTASDYYTPPKKRKPKIEASVSTKSIDQILKKGQCIRTNIGYWAAKSMKGTVRYFETEKEAQRFANHAANEAAISLAPPPTGWPNKKPSKPHVTNNGRFWVAWNATGDVGHFNSEEKAQQFADSMANEAKQPMEQCPTCGGPLDDNYCYDCEKYAFDKYDDGESANEAKKFMSPDDHAKIISKRTLKMPDAIANVMGGPTKKQSAEYLKNLKNKNS